VTLAAVAGALVFAIAGLLGVVCAQRVCVRLERFADGPPPASPKPVFIVTLIALAGACFAMHGITPATLATGALTAFALAGCWYCDLARGIVPDCFTLLPLTCLCVFAGAQQDWNILFSVAVPFAPFALAASFSRGRGMGWGDAKLVALGGAVLGMRSSVLAFALSCLAVGIVSCSRGRRGSPVAFAPYLVVAVASGLAFGAHA
jgi:prepilin signal peptidase PulO-like enzyme (type II secretory pathway)